MDSRNRQEFLEGFCPGGKYSNVVGIYRENASAGKIGIFDKELINGLSSSVKWIAHNGAGYDPVDVQACISKGTSKLGMFRSWDLYFVTRYIPFQYSWSC